MLRSYGKELEVEGFSAKIDLQYGQIIHDDVDYIDYQTLKEKIDSKETFIVTVYAKNCSCWSMLHTNLIDYISKNHIQVFAVNYDNFHDASGKTLDNFNLNIAVISISPFLCFSRLKWSFSRMFNLFENLKSPADSILFSFSLSIT